MAGELRLSFDTTVRKVRSGDTLVVNINNGESSVSLSLNWVLTRTRAGQVSITDKNAQEDLGEPAVINYASSWNVDYSNYAGKTIPCLVDAQSETGDGDLADAVIVLNDPVWTFEIPTGSLIEDGVVTHDINGNVVETPISVSHEIVANPEDPCNLVGVRITMAGDTGVYEIKTSTDTYSNVTSPYIVTFNRRSVNQLIKIVGENTDIGTILVNLPRKIEESDISIEPIIQIDGSMSVSINVGYINTNITPYEYSIDGSTYQSSNSFPSLLPGSYTVYIRDSFGCVTTKDFIIDGVTVLTEIVFQISAINPIRFFKSRAAGEKKNILNSLSCEELKDVAYSGSHLYPSTSINTIQIQTNAPYRRVYAIDKDGAETDIPNAQIVKNTNITGYTTATLSSRDGLAVLHWGYVSVLDPDTDEVIGNTNFGSFVPTWADDSGKRLEVSTLGVTSIQNIYYDSEKQSNVVQLNISYSGPEAQVNVKGTYNEQPYDVYEFQVNMLALPPYFTLKIDYGQDENNLKTPWISEPIKRIIDSDEYIKLDYWDDDNRGNFIYQTGTQHHVYVKGAMDYVGEQNTEGYNGDSEYYKVNDEVYFSFNLIIEFLPSVFAHFLRLITAHEYLYVNGLRCKLAESPEIEGEVATNLKTFTALLKTSGDEFLPGALANVIAEEDNISGALEAIQGKANLLWTKING